jgi:hypothetical protein
MAYFDKKAIKKLETINHILKNLKVKQENNSLKFMLEYYKDHFFLNKQVQLENLNQKKDQKRSNLKLVCHKQYKTILLKKVYSKKKVNNFIQWKVKI